MLAQRLVQPAEPLQGGAAVEMRAGESRRQRDRPVVAGDGVVERGRAR